MANVVRQVETQFDQLSEGFRAILTRIDGSPIADITSLIINLSIVESLTSSTYYGRCIIDDSLGLITGTEKISFTGEEILIFKGIKSEVSSLRKDYTFFISSLKNEIIPDLEDNIIYELTLESVDNFFNNGIIKSKSYTGTITNIIRNIIISELNNNINRQDLINERFDETDDEITFPFLALRPLEKIEILKQMARKNDQNHINYYAFFQTYNGYNFRSLTSIIEKSKEKKPLKYIFDETAFRNRHNPYVILDYMKPRRFHMKEKIAHGFFKTNVHTYNFFTKQYEKKTYNILDELTNITRLQRDTFFSDNFRQYLERRNITGLDYFIPIREGQVRNVSVPSKEVNNRTESLVKSNPLLSLYKDFLLEIKIYGNTDLNIGDSVSISLPLRTLRDATKSGEDVIDRNISGIYIIDTITTNIELNDYGSMVIYTGLTLFKDGRDVISNLNNRNYLTSNNNVN